MSSVIVLCRRTLNNIGQPVEYCARPIKARSELNWCPDCLAMLPIWPVDDAS